MITNLQARKKMLQLMDTFVLDKIDDEEEQVGWFVNAVPDGNGTDLDDYGWIAEDEELYEACVKYFDETYFKEYEEEFKEYIAEDFLKNEKVFARKKILKIFNKTLDKNN